MAQSVNPLSFRLGKNLFWNSSWYSNKYYTIFLKNDYLLKIYFKHIFETRGFFFKRFLIKRLYKITIIFIEVYGLPYFRYNIRNISKKKTIKLKNILKKIKEKKIKIVINNLFLINKTYIVYFKRLRQLFWYFRFAAFMLPVLNVFCLFVRVPATDMLIYSICREIEILESKKRNKSTWLFIRFIKKLFLFSVCQNGNILGIRIQLKGRFASRRRTLKVRCHKGMIPCNTIRALIDYEYITAITTNGSFGIKLWVCYTPKFC